MKRIRTLWQFLFVLVLIQGALLGKVNSQNVNNPLLADSNIDGEERVISLEHMLDDIEKRYRVTFLYEEQVVAGKYLNSKQILLGQTTGKKLVQVLTALNLDYYQLDEETYVLVEKKSSLLSGYLLQQEAVTGIVTDAGDGASLPGVNVMVKGTTIGTSTGSDGSYKLDAPSLKDTLIFSFVGYQTQEVPINGRSEIDVQLASQTVEGEEMVVVAFGEQQKEEVVGSVTLVTASELQKTPSSNLTTALAGRMSGIIAYQRSGEPGQDNAKFFIRGVTTFGYKKDPLILIDGLELSSTDLARLQPDDIASFSIMKDATATALYGARGANGVISVTTKEGVEGSTKISVRLENSISTPTEEVDLAGPVTYMQMHNEAVLTRNPLGILPYSQSKIDNTKAGANSLVYPAINWKDMLFKDYTMNQRANFNVSGGGKVARYYLSGSFTQDNGVLKVDQRNNFNSNIDLKTYLLRSNVDIDITETTQVGVKLYGSFDDYTGPIDGGEGMYEKVMRANPVLFPPYYSATNDLQHVQHILFGNYEEGNYINPYADMVKGYREYTRALMLAQFELEQDLSFVTEGLSLRAMANTNRRSYFDVSRFYDPFYYQIGFYNRVNDDYNLSVINEDSGTEYLGYDEGAKDITSNFYLESAFSYNRTFRDLHGVSGMLVFQMRNELQANAGDLQLSLPYRNIGVSGRFTYNYDSRYFGEFNFGFNGSERFYKTERFGLFPSAGLAWQISNEDFWRPIQPVISNLKIRATYGLVGNDAIGSAEDRFFYLSNVDMNSGGRGASFGTDNGYYRDGVSISRYSNRNITWETARMTNFGIELGLFEKLNLNIDLYKEYRTNILMDRSSIPSTMGLQAPIRANVGEASSKGMDVSFDYNHYFGTKAWLTARGNFTYATSAYEVYEEPEYEEEYLSHIGHPIGQVYGYIAERLFVDEEEVQNSPPQNFGEYSGGDIKYRDVNKDGQITSLDEVPIGYPRTPEIVYGFGFSAGYKNIDLSAFFQGSARSSFWIDANATAPFIDVDASNGITEQNALLKAYAQDHWSEENRDLYALWPRFDTTGDSENNAQWNTWFMRNGSFLRLKTVELGYTLPVELQSKFSLTNARIYVSGSNLLTFSKFKLWDPEMGANGLGYPIQKVINVGIEISF